MACLRLLMQADAGFATIAPRSPAFNIQIEDDRKPIGMDSAANEATPSSPHWPGCTAHPATTAVTVRPVS
jgi:hypothetical protein